MKPQVDDGLPATPRGLKPRSKRLFRAVVRDYALDAAGLATLEEACRALDRVAEAAAIVAEEGMVVYDRFNQAKVHPAAILERDHRAAFSRLIVTLGLDPRELDNR